MPLLSPETEEVMRFAAFEVLVRGTGAKGQYNYTLLDCHVVAAALHRGRTWLLENPNYGETAINLYDAILLSKKEPAHG